MNRELGANVRAGSVSPLLTLRVGVRTSRRVEAGVSINYIAIGAKNRARIREIFSEGGGGRGKERSEIRTTQRVGAARSHAERVNEGLKDQRSIRYALVSKLPTALETGDVLFHLVDHPAQRA